MIVFIFVLCSIFSCALGQVNVTLSWSGLSDTSDLDLHVFTSCGCHAQYDQKTCLLSDQTFVSLGDDSKGISGQESAILSGGSSTYPCVTMGIWVNAYSLPENMITFPTENVDVTVDGIPITLDSDESQSLYSAGATITKIVLTPEWNETEQIKPRWWHVCDISGPKLPPSIDLTVNELMELEIAYYPEVTAECKGENLVCESIGSSFSAITITQALAISLLATIIH